MAIFRSESLETFKMNKKSHPFSTLTENELDAIITRAQRERAEAIATAFIWLGRLLRAVLLTPIIRLWSVAHRHADARNALPIEGNRGR